MKKLMIVLLMMAPLAHVNAKTIEQDGKTYACNPVESCEDKVKRLQNEIAKLKAQVKQLKEASTQVVVVEEKIVEKQVVVSHVEFKEAPENIVSLALVSGQNGLSRAQTSPSRVDIETQRMLGAGLMYQRRVSDSLYIGGQVDTNESVGLNVGIGF